MMFTSREGRTFLRSAAEIVSQMQDDIQSGRDLETFDGYKLDTPLTRPDPRTTGTLFGIYVAQCLADSAESLRVYCVEPKIASGGARGLEDMVVPGFILLANLVRLIIETANVTPCKEGFMTMRCRRGKLKLVVTMNTDEDLYVEITGFSDRCT